METSEGPGRSLSRRGREGAWGTLGPFLHEVGLRVSYPPSRNAALPPPRPFLRNFHGDLPSRGVEGNAFPPRTAGQRGVVGTGDCNSAWTVWDNPARGIIFRRIFPRRAPRSSWIFVPSAQSTIAPARPQVLLAATKVLVSS